MSRYTGPVDPRPSWANPSSPPPHLTPYHRYHNIPTPRTGTYNIYGYSANSTGPEMNLRKGSGN